VTPRVNARRQPELAVDPADACAFISGRVYVMGAFGGAVRHVRAARAAER
jgi:hypothetical protein